MKHEYGLEWIQHWYPKVKKIAYAKSNFRFDVSPKDAKEGVRFDAARCSAARGCQHTPGVIGALIKKSVGYLIFESDPTIAYRYIHPESIRKEIVSIDRGAYFAPGTYELKKPWAGNKLINKYPPQRTKKVGSRGKRDTTYHVTAGVR